MPSKIRKTYMIGIKGVGMTMLAQFLAAKGDSVSGSDTSETYMTDQVLKDHNIPFKQGFDVNNIPKDANQIIYSTAYNEKTNEEVAAVLKQKKIKVLTYAEALGQVFNQYYGIAVVGSHGKTTTSAWLGYVLEKSGYQPNVMVGAQVPQFGGNTLIGSSNYLVAEVDEYQNKLQYFQPKAVVLNNIDYDHPDYFPTKEDYDRVFLEFIQKIPQKGFLVANLDDQTTRKYINVNAKCRIITYGIKEAGDYVAYDIKIANGKQYFKVKIGVEDDNSKESVSDKELGDFVISLSGRHNISNALAVIATCIELGLELSDIRTHLEDFTGTARRMQLVGEFRGAVIIDDYAHHPAEIMATLDGVKQMYPKKNVLVVFHPHTYSRTKGLLDDFANSFSLADEVIVVEIYGSAREKQGGVSSQDLVDRIKNVKAQNIHTLKEVEEYLRENIGNNDVVVLMGAGDIFRVGENLVK